MTLRVSSWANLQIGLMASEECSLGSDKFSLIDWRHMEAPQNIHGSSQGIPDLGWGGGHMDHKIPQPQAIKLTKLKRNIVGQAKGVPHLQTSEAVAEESLTHDTSWCKLSYDNDLRMVN